MEPVYKPYEIPLPEELLRIASVFQEHGKELFLVGGAVRDALLGLKPKDYDVATNATPDEIITMFRARKDHLILEIGKSFGVIKLISLPSLAEYEVATFRSDVGKGRRPDSVVFTTIEEDVKRRDFTINALFYDIQQKHVVDYVGGLQDLEFNIIRTVGNPEERFDEDRLRILRAMRFCGRFQTLTDKATHQAIKADNSLEGVSPERIRDEFLKGIASAREPKFFLLLLTAYNFWPQIFPRLKVFSEGSFLSTKNLPVQLAYLLQENDPKVVAKVLNDLKYSSEEVSQVTFLLSFQGLQVENAFRLKKLFKHSHLTQEDVLLFSELLKKPSPELVSAFFRYEPSITGDELMAQGFQGKALGAEQTRRETELFRALLA
jgi:tRNA nucleotidyltransferase/poly(A) polymerase